jgi:hypothetical protein
MARKMNCFFVFFLLSVIWMTPSIAQNTVKIGGRLGANLSQAMSVPKSLNENGHSYSVGYIPGYNWAGVLEYKRKHFSLVAGAGLKSLNFNFERKYPPPYSYYEKGYSRFPITRTLAMVRLNYITMPLKLCLYLGQKQRVFISLGGEYAGLISNMNTENIRWPGTQLFLHKVDDWFKRDMIFLTAGAGLHLQSGMRLALEIGVTPMRIDKAYEPVEGYEQGYFYFSKRALEIRIELGYDFYEFDL